MKKKWSAERYFDEWKLAVFGVRKVFFKKEFLIPAFLAFLIFGTLLNLLSGGSAAISLIPVVDFGNKIQIIWSALIKTFGFNQPSVFDWAFSFLIALLQGILIGLVVYVFKARKAEKKRNTINSESQNESKSSANSVKSASAAAQDVGIIAGLAILGSGCPTCGTTLLMPVIVSIVGSSSMALASTVSFLLTAASVIIALFALKKMGLEAYMIFMDEKYRSKHDKIKLEKNKGPKN